MNVIRVQSISQTTVTHVTYEVPTSTPHPSTTTIAPRLHSKNTTTTTITHQPTTTTTCMHFETSITPPYNEDYACLFV
eukprot:m.90148 g.90148  ORF g.90148 m.90148 type:complete len:78 (+) comp26368_c0_seq1:122-355(+)